MYEYEQKKKTADKRAGGIIQRYLIIKTDDYTDRYYCAKRTHPETAGKVMEDTITAIAVKMLDELDAKRRTLIRGSEEDTYLKEIEEQIIQDPGGKLRSQIRAWIADEAGSASKNLDFGKKFQPRAYKNYYEAALALTGWVNAKPGRQEEKEKAEEILKDPAVSYHLDSVFMKLKHYIDTHTNKSTITSEIQAKSAVTHKMDGTPLAKPAVWTLYKSYFSGKGNRHELPDYWAVLNDPKAYDIRQKTGVLHDLMHYFYEKSGDELLFKGLHFDATTLAGRRPYDRPDNSQIRGDRKLVKGGGGHLNLRDPNVVKFSAEETSPSYEYARRKHLPMYARHSFSAARMMGLAREAGAKKEEIAAVGWAIMAYWRRHYDHTQIPYHTAHEIMDFAPAFGIAYDLDDRFAGFKVLSDDFPRFLYMQVKAGDTRAARAIIAYHKSPFNAAKYLLQNKELWTNEEIMKFLSTTFLPLEEFLQFTPYSLREFFQYNENTQKLFHRLPKERQDHVRKL